MKLEINEKRFSLKYAIIYTLIIIIILLIPFAIYTKYRYTLQEIKTERMLKQKTIHIINKMENFNLKQEKYFYFPRYKSFKTGLYDADGNKIFSTIEDIDISILDFKSGYNELGKYRYYVTKFIDDRYFYATYLIVMTEFNRYAVLENILIIFFLILMIVFLFSFILLKNFAKPFNEVNKALDDFIKDAMHEINTPLSIISINVDILSEKYGKNRYLSRIKSASKILSTIYDDLNYLIKEQTINKAVSKEINFSQFLNRSVDYFKEIAELKDITIITEIEEDIYIDFIPTKLQKIIDNNLSNAIKYSYEDSKIIISLSQDEKRIYLGFKDFGIGIQDTQKIFSRYYRENNAKGGFGIGLNIVGKIINEENIKVNIDSKLEKGSFFEYIFEKKAKKV